MASSAQKLISGKTVAEHNTRQSCWIIVHGQNPYAYRKLKILITSSGKVYDVTEFLDGTGLFQLETGS